MYRNLTRGALLLALMAVLQSLRLLIPLPPFVSMFVVGSAVNACLLTAAELLGWRACAVLAAAAPVIAYVQQVLLLPVFIFPVALGNLAYGLLYILLLPRGRYLAIVSSAAAKMLALYAGVALVLNYVELPGKLATVLQMMMSWPQLVTGICGGLLAAAAVKRLRQH